MRMRAQYGQKTSQAILASAHPRGALSEPHLLGSGV
jgi:hypothetical protein